MTADDARRGQGLRPRQGDPGRRARGRLRPSARWRPGSRSGITVDGARRAAGGCACRPGASTRRAGDGSDGRDARWRRSCGRLEAPALDFDGRRDRSRRAPGLGSSAALAVAVARAAAAAMRAHAERPRRSRPPSPRRRRCSTATRRASTRRPRRAAAPGGSRAPTAGSRWPVRQAITLCVGLSGRPRDTAAQVAAVARLRDRLPAADDMLASLGELADDGERGAGARATSTGWGGSSTPRTACWPRCASRRPSWTRWCTRRAPRARSAPS